MEPLRPEDRARLRKNGATDKQIDHYQSLQSKHFSRGLNPEQENELNNLFIQFNKPKWEKLSKPTLLLDRLQFWLIRNGLAGRITVGMVREAMRISGLKLFRGGFFSQAGKACCAAAQLGVAARIIDEDLSPKAPFFTSWHIKDKCPGLTTDYLQTFMLGFDTDTKISSKGGRDGRKVQEYFNL